MMNQRNGYCNSLKLTLLSMASVSAAATAALAQTATGAAPQPEVTIEDIVVTARRSSELLQDVPVAVSVISQKAIAQTPSFAPYDLPKLATGLSVVAATGSRTNVTYSIRGQNKAFGTTFPAVVPYFNEVPVPTLTAGSFFDLENVQVLRGPQGVLFGRVTDGGNIMVTSKRPVEHFEGYAGVTVGDYSLHNFSGALNVPLIGNALIVRGAFQIDRRGGFTKNDFNGKDLDDVHSDSFRLSVLLTPASGFENYTVASYQNINSNGNSTLLGNVNPVAVLNSTGNTLSLFPGVYGLNSNGQVLPFQDGLTPLTPESLTASLQDQLAAQKARGVRRVFATNPTFNKERILVVVNTTSVDINDSIQFKNIFGYTKFTQRTARTVTGDNSNMTAVCNSACLPLTGTGSNLPDNSQQQLSDEIRLAGKSFDGTLTWSIGAYFDEQKPAELYTQDTVNIGILRRLPTQIQRTRSKAGFFNVEYDFASLLPGLKLNGGFRHTVDTVKSSNVTYLYPLAAPFAAPTLASVLEFLGQPAEVAAAVADGTVNLAVPYGACVTLPAPSLFGPFSCLENAATFKANTWTVGASYKMNSGTLLYAKVSRGYRPGGAQLVSSPDIPVGYKPEYDTSYEAGIKADWRIGGVPLRTNLAVFHDDYSDIQRLVVVPIGGIPTSFVDNAAAAKISGVELEAQIRPFEEFSLGVNYAYTSSHFVKQDTSGPSDPCNPALFTVVGFCTDNRLAYTPTHQLSLTADYTLPLDENLGVINVGALFHFQTSTSLTDTSALNPDGVEPAYGTLELNAGWKNIFGRPVDLNVFITNVTNKIYRDGSTSVTQNSSIGLNGDVYAAPRMFGLSLKYRFGGND
jgi:iron complex outermembrane recepter protein